MNIAENEAYVVVPPYSLEQAYNTLKTDLYDIQETEFNLMNDSQKLADLQKAYLDGVVDYSAVLQAQKELAKTRAQWLTKALKYINDSAAFEYALYGPITTLPYPDKPKSAKIIVE